MQDFEFVDSGRTFYCSIETPRHAGMPPWWFFRLDGRDSTRYAPFAASSGDTKQSVKKRILEYYAELLAIKARPVHPRPTWTRPAKPAEPVAAGPPQETRPAAATS